MKPTKARIDFLITHWLDMAGHYLRAAQRYSGSSSLSRDWIIGSNEGFAMGFYIAASDLAEECGAHWPSFSVWEQWFKGNADAREKA